ncbi:MAG: NAD-specific glutamate dehydrogenase [Syntrophorhabdus sp. PtaB.Bin184]|nr:MAG: NAD-specific glutamate dehydrogenase [Syntrophorhabdus sp. PtaB.Bin184]
MGVAIGRFDLDDVVAYLEDGYVEGAAAKVIDRNGLILFLVKSVCQGGSRRLVDDAKDVESRYPSGVLRGLPLGIVEIGRYGYDRVVDLLTEVRLG